MFFKRRSDLKEGIDRNAILHHAPMDHGLYDNAKRRKGHISDKEVMDEYNRLLWKKLRRSAGENPPRQRGLFARLFGL